MALVPTVTDVAIISGGSTEKKRIVGTLAFDNLYQTNGMSLLNSKLGVDSVSMIAIAPTSGYVFEYVVSTKKVKAYYVPTGTNASAAALGEVAVNTDLSALNTVAFECFGNG